MLINWTLAISEQNYINNLSFCIGITIYKNLILFLHSSHTSNDSYPTISISTLILQINKMTSSYLKPTNFLFIIHMLH